MIYFIYLELFGDVLLLNLMTVVVMFLGYDGYYIATLLSYYATLSVLPRNATVLLR
jgi:hypothetical protein